MRSIHFLYAARFRSRRGLIGGVALPLLLLTALAGCVKIERDYPEKNFFGLEARRTAPAAPTPLFGDLRLGRVQVASPFAGKPFVYRLEGLRMEEDFYNRFFSPPGDLLTESTARWLRASGLFSQIFTQPAPTEPPWFLEETVSALYGDFAGAPPQAVLEIGFILFRETASGTTTVLSRDYRREIPLEQKTAAALAAAWSRALTEILAAFEQDLHTAAGGGSSGKEP